MKPIAGPCKAAYTRFYFDPTTNSCQQFTYGGKFYLFYNTTDNTYTRGVYMLICDKNRVKSRNNLKRMKYELPGNPQPVAIPY